MVSDSYNKKTKEETMTDKGQSKLCVICDKEFAPKNYWQKFCSKKCGLLSWAKKELDKKKKSNLNERANKKQ